MIACGTEMVGEEGEEREQEKMNLHETEVKEKKGIDSKDVIEGAKNGLLLGKETKEDSNKKCVKKEIEAAEPKEGDIDASKAIEGAKKGKLFVETAGTVKVTPSVVGTGGSVEPNSVQSIKVGERAKFKVKPNMGYKIKSITGCGLTGDPKEEFETGSIVTDCSLQITFENKMQLMNGGGRMQAPASPGSPTLDKRALPGGRPTLNLPQQRKLIPMPPIQEKK